MIVDAENNNMTNDVPRESPPSYDYATDTGSHQVPIGAKLPCPDIKQTTLQASPLQVYTGVGPSQLQQPTYVVSPTVYHYTNPQTNERIASLLPPDHPEMLCLQAGAHVPHTRYGVVGILAAVFWFPLGIGLCLLDRQVRCTRCGVTINDGMCG